MLLRLLPFLLALLAAAPAAAQSTEAPALALTLEEALQIALERGYAVRTAELEVERAGAQIREAWGQLMPSVDASASYTRNVVSANPFAGSDAGGLFSSFGLIDWLAYNERARTDGDPSTEPITLEEFRRRQAQGFAEAGLVPGESDNPFAVANQFQNQLAISQTLYSGRAFAALRGARSLRAINRAALTEQQFEAIVQTRRLFYAALLAQEQAEVARASVERTEATREETARRVAAGTLPKFERLTAEVELANLEAQRIQAENQARLARTNLLFTLGLPVTQEIPLRGRLEMPEDALAETIALEDAVAVALERRPDLEQARLAIDLQRVNRDMARSAYFPEVSAFATLAYTGSVPSDRTLILQGTDPEDPFAVSTASRGFFSGAYWNPSVAVGARLTWNLFNGLQTSYQVQQRELDIRQAQIALEQATQAAVLETEQALRNLASARQRILAQRENVRTAQTAYDFAAQRLATGVSTQIDVRLASTQLDQAQLSYLQAVYDYLEARSQLERAVGVVLPEPIGASDFVLTATDSAPSPLSPLDR